MPPGIRPQNLNDVFQAAAKQARQKLPELSHNQKVGENDGRFLVFSVSQFLVRPLTSCSMFRSLGCPLVQELSPMLAELGRRS